MSATALLKASSIASFALSTGGRMRYQSRESKDFPGAWIVEAVDPADGDSPSSVLFCGFEARERADAHAAEKNAELRRDAPG